MKVSKKTVRTTEIVLTDEEFRDAIRQYLISKNIVDANQHLVFTPRETRDDRGLELDITLKNYNL